MFRPTTRLRFNVVEFCQDRLWSSEPSSLRVCPEPVLVNRTALSQKQRAERENQTQEAVCLLPIVLSGRCFSVQILIALSASVVAVMLFSSGPHLTPPARACAADGCGGAALPTTTSPLPPLLLTRGRRETAVLRSRYVPGIKCRATQCHAKKLPDLKHSGKSSRNKTQQASDSSHLRPPRKCERTCAARRRHHQRRHGHGSCLLHHGNQKTK